MQFCIDALSFKTPQGLDEAAEELANEHGFIKHPSCKPARYPYQAVRDVFIEAAKTGAKWMAEQGESFETRINNISFVRLPKLNIQAGDKVIVQIRKKDD